MQVTQDRLVGKIKFFPVPQRPKAVRLLTCLEISQPIDDVFAFFADAANLQRITPPWLHFRFVMPLPIEMHAGALIDYRLRLRGFPIHWRTEISEWNPPGHFVDRQLSRPYRLWEHTHTFEATRHGTRVTDSVDYIVPGGRIMERLPVRPDLRRIFFYRQEQIMAHFRIDH